MAYFDLDSIIAECIREHARVATVARGHNMENKETIYKESFRAMNNWVETRLSTKKGAELPMLGQFTWEIKQSGDGRQFSRPIFLLSDNFVKDHKVKRQRSHVNPNVAKSEEINYSKLAIKFSKTCTKDMIFSGTRDILKKIGDYVDKNYEFVVEFSFGTLKCKERKVRFDFNQARLAAILPENLRIGTLPQEAEVAETPGGGPHDNGAESSISGNQYSARGGGYEESPRVSTAELQSQAEPLSQRRPVPKLSLGGSRSNSAAHAQSGTVSFTNTGAASIMGVVADTTGAGTEASDFFNTENGAAGDNVGDMTVALTAPPARADDTQHEHIHMPDRELSPRLLEIMQEMEASLNAPRVDKVEMRNRAKGRVEEQAYLRALNQLDAEARVEEKIAVQADEQMSEFEDKVRTKVSDFHNKTKTINGWLTEQMAANKQMRDEKLAAQRKYQGSFFLPENAGNVLMPSGSLPGGLHKKAIKEGLRKDLKYQIRNNMERRQHEKVQNTQEERDYLDHVAMEMDLDAIEERAKHLEQQKMLLESWERDAHVRNLKKLQMGGSQAVTDYVSVNLPDAVDPTEGTLRPAISFNKSVGFDTRKGK